MSTTFPESYSETPQNLNLSVNTQIISDTLNWGHSNFYSFNLKGRSSFNLDLEDFSPKAHVDLIRDTNGNNLVDDDEVINSSLFSSTNAESINQNLDAGLYYIQVSIDEGLETNYKLAVSAIPIDYAGNSLQAARHISVNSKTNNYSGWVGISDTNDYYQFGLKTTSDFQLGLSELSDDTQVQLLDGNGNTLASSFNGDIINESINLTLNAGTYYVQVNSYNDSETFYNLSLSTTPVSGSVSSPTPTSVNTSFATSINPQQPTTASVSTLPIFNNSTYYEKGTLKADTFTYKSAYNRTVYSGNGNVEYGSGRRDLLDLSAFYSTSATIKLVESTGGVMYNPGNGTRLFDAITLRNGKEILFEGIEAIKFADKTINLSVTPNDPLFGQQWNLHMMGIQSAWRFTKGSTNVLIGIEDTGLAANGGNLHFDLRSSYLLDNNYLDDMSHPTTHGTSIEGVIAAASNNGVGISGINWYSDVFQIDVVGNDAGDYNLVSATQALINQANSKGQRLVVNLSLTGGSSWEFEQLIANNQNTALFVIAAGNSDANSLESPADLAKKYGNVVAVGASWGLRDWYGNPTTPGTRISYNNPRWWASNKGDGLTLVAPSEYLTTNATKFSYGFGFGYDDRFNGTSAAVPNVTGVASLIWSVNSNLTATQIKSILSETAYDLGPSGYDTEYGYGFINADAAVRRAMALARGAA